MAAWLCTSSLKGEFVRRVDCVRAGLEGAGLEGGGLEIAEKQS